MTGPLALIGGSEHLPGCESTDRWLLAANRKPDPVVTILPLASSFRTRKRAIDRATRWWRSHGVDPIIAGRGTAMSSEAIARADIIVLTGGVPDRLYARLVGSATWRSIVARWRQGAALSGSSSGAMVMGSVRQSVHPPFPVVSAFGLLPDTAIAPHNEQWGPRVVARWRSERRPGLTIIGIDERTALVRTHIHEFRVMGAGGITIYRGGHGERHEAGAVIEPESLGLSRPSAPAPQAPQRVRSLLDPPPGPAEDRAV